MSKAKEYCQDELNPRIGVRCKKPCSKCLEFYGEFYNLKDEYKHEEDE